MTITTPDQILDLAGRTFALDDRGPRDGGALPLVLLHGFTGGRLDWADVIDPLADDRRVVAWDHRGHAASANEGPYTFDALVDDALAVLDHLGIDRFHLLGHSMGGIVAMRLVARRPAAVASLILMDTLVDASLTMPDEIRNHIVSVGRSEGMGAVAAMFVSFMKDNAIAPPDVHAAVLERMVVKLEGMDVEAFAALGDGLSDLAGEDTPGLAAIACPTTVVVGENDTPLRPQADKIAAAVPGSTLVVIPGAGHSPQDEGRDDWMAAVRAHLAGAGA